MQINAYQEALENTKINNELNKQPLKNIGTLWNIRHR